MSATSMHETLTARIVKSLNEGDYAAYESLLTEDYVEDYPQSGEVIRGPKNSRAVLEHYPGGFPESGRSPSGPHVEATVERWVRTPTFTVVRTHAAGNTGTVAYKSQYPDGSVWWVIKFYELRGDRIARATFFFAPMFEPPEWRKPYRELLGSAERP